MWYADAQSNHIWVLAKVKSEIKHYNTCKYTESDNHCHFLVLSLKLKMENFAKINSVNST